MDKIVLDTLANDAKSRESAHHNSQQVDLFLFDDIHHNDWDYSLPTLKYEYDSELNNVPSLDDFIKNFYKKIPFNISMDNIIFAGGSVCSILTGEKMNDIDIFIYGLSEQEANNRIDQLIAELYDILKKSLSAKKYQHERNVKFTYIKNTNCVTIILNDFVFQIILRIYSSKSEILYGFDIGSSAVGFDGKEVYYTHLSKFSYEYSCNIIDYTRRSITYEHRLVKYFNRGFEIIMPNMNIRTLCKINQKYNVLDVCVMPYLIFSYSSVNGNKITVSTFLNMSNKSDYQIQDLTDNIIFYINLNNLVNDETDYYFYTDNRHKIPQVPFMSRRRIIDFYDSMFKKLFEKGILNTKILKKYIKDTKPILAVLIDEEKDNKDFHRTLYHHIENEKQRVLVINDNVLNAPHPLAWVIDNPGTQLTSSFNPIIDDEKIWYGDHYLATLP